MHHQPINWRQYIGQYILAEMNFTSNLFMKRKRKPGEWRQFYAQDVPEVEPNRILKF